MAGKIFIAEINMRNFLRFLVRLLVGTVARVEVYGRENIPAGSFVLATNHLGLIDAALAYYALDRWDLFVMVAEKWKEIWIFRFLGKYFDFIFIDRFNPDLQAMREVIKKMKEGKVLVIAPEGTRSRVGAMIEGKPGVSYLAAKLGYSILPVGLAGTDDKTIFGNMRRLRRSHIVVRAGKTFDLPPLPKENREQVLQQYTDEIMCRIAALIPEKYRGYYADHPRLKELLASPAP
jgi:1-acyl-sn-glycerol-3-phosphate acyltransferase